MDPKSFLKNKSVCTLPWTGFELEPNGDVKNCIISRNKLGNINHTKISDILNGEANIKLKQDMLADRKPSNCEGCYLQEKARSDLNSISSRLYYHKEIASKMDLSMLDNVNKFDLKHVDLRWTNSCNQACVYCNPEWSSKWSQEMNQPIKSNKEARQEVKDFVFENIEQLQNVYLAGGEPMLMKDNKEFLELLKDKNPECHIRVNTNLSTTRTGIFELLCSFKNVHWTVSVDTIEQEYEYIRHHGSWTDFLDNLDTINKLDHKISFNMLHFILNRDSLHDCVDLLRAKGFHDNSFIAGPLFRPYWWNMLNLPEHMITQATDRLKQRINEGATGYLKNSYENCLSYFTTTPWNKDLARFRKEIDSMDKRRNVNSTKVFKKLFEELDA